MKTKYKHCKNCKVLHLDGYTTVVRKILCSNCNGKGNFDKLEKEVDLYKEFEQLNKKSDIPPCLIVQPKNKQLEFQTRLI